MGSLLHSPFLQALGYAIINSLWQFALLWLLYYSINTIFRLSSHQKYCTGLVLQFAGFIWFLVTLHFYYNESVLLPSPASITHDTQLVGANNTGSVKQKFFLLVLRSERYFPYLSIAYLALLFTLVARWVYAYIYTQKVRTAGLQEIDDGWQLFVQKLTERLQIRRTVRIYLSNLVDTPLTIGFVKPLILIPVASVNYLSVQQLEAVILHEMAHIKRVDYLFNLLLAFIEACLFFNPFMQLIHQQIKKERENCCDDWVIKFEYCAATYATALFNIASHHTHSLSLALKAADNKQLLLNRIKRIIEKKEPTFFNYKHQLLALFMMTSVLSTLSFLTPAKKTATSAKALSRRNIVWEPIAANVTNPLFNPVFFLANPPKTEAEHKKKAGETKPGKAEIRFSHVSAPPEPPAPADPEAISEEENEITLEQPESVPLAQLPAKSRAATTIWNNPVRSQEKTEEQEIIPRSVDRSRIRQSAPSFKHFKTFTWKLFSKASLQKAKTELESALASIKSVRKHSDVTKLQELKSLKIKKIATAAANIGPTIIDDFEMDQLELLEQEITRAIDSIRIARFSTSVSNASLNFSLQIPAAVYTFTDPKEHTFSFEYSDRSKIKIVRAPEINDCQKAQKRKQRVVVRDDDEGCNHFPPPPPNAPARVRTIQVIRI